jgi:hypothetical protein
VKSGSLLIILKGDPDVSEISQTSGKGLEIVRGQIASSKGLGREMIVTGNHLSNWSNGHGIDKTDIRRGV